MVSLTPAHCGCCGMRSSRTGAARFRGQLGLRSDGACGSAFCMQRQRFQGKVCGRLAVQVYSCAHARACPVRLCWWLTRTHPQLLRKVPDSVPDSGACSLS